MSEGPPPRHYFQCTAPDRAMYAIGKHQPSSIHVRVDLHGLLDAERLALAWRRLPELHPILGCTLPHPALRPRWRPGRSAPRELVETSETAPSQTEAPGPAELRLLNEALDVRRGPPARLALLRRPDATHRLLLSVHHAAMDARATVNVANAVNELYGALARHPEIELAPDYSLRTMREVFRQQGVRSKQRRRLARGQQGREGRIGKSRHRDPRPQKGIAYRRGTVTYREWILEPDVLAGLSPRRQEAGWTLNDVLLGLLAWSWARALGAGEHKRKMSAWLATADARPWFGVQGGLGNLSGLEPVGLPGVEQADPSGAVAIAHSAMAECKAGRLG
ncbi:MAG: condensation domain-containing protein, partial [bacterium]